MPIDATASQSFTNGLGPMSYLAASLLTVSLLNPHLQQVINRVKDSFSPETHFTMETGDTFTTPIDVMVGIFSIDKVVILSILLYEKNNF